MPASGVCIFEDAGQCVRNAYAWARGATDVRPSKCASAKRQASPFSGCHCPAGFRAFEWPMSANAICTG